VSEGAGQAGGGPAGRPRVALHEDGGSRAAGGEFFRCAEFFAAEGVTHTLEIELPGGIRLSAPLLVRAVPDPDRGGGGAAESGAPAAEACRDAVSPYGYPGLASTGPDDAARLDPAAVDWSAAGLVTIFIRHHLGGPPPLTGATARNAVLISDPELPRKSRMSDRQQIRKNLRAGFEVAITPGPQTSAAQRAAFLAAYTETMRRTEAAPRYFFDAAYFDRVLSADSTWLFLITEPGGEVAAGSIAARSDGMLHYYLSGTADAHLRGAPMKSILAEMTDFAWERSLPLNLGGGIRPGDPLEEFKRGFANREERLHTSELICDPVAYRRLSGDRDPADFFPAYRAPRGASRLG
jgi:hypothetical protein